MKKNIFLLLLTLTFGVATQGQTANTLLWKIDGAGLQSPSYLYGTMHTSRDEVFGFIDSVLIDFDKAEAYVMEINPDSINKGALQQMMVLKGDTTIKSLLTQEEYKKFAKSFKKKTGYPLLLFNRIKPLYLMLMMQEGKKSKGKPLDLFFNDLAEKKGKKIYGLERAEDQMALLDGISTQLQMTLLRQAINQPDEENDLEEQLFNNYLKGDLDALLEITESDTSMGADFGKKFIQDRNKVMTKGIIRIIPKSPSFIAVGAAHLPGKHGIISLLRQNGYTVTPIFSEKREDPKKVKKL